MIPTFDFINVVRQAAKAILSTLASPVAICSAFALVSGGVVAGLSGLAISNFMASVEFSFSLPADEVGLIDLLLYTVSPEELVRVVRLMLSAIPAFFAFCVTSATAFMAGLWVYRFAFASRSAAKDAVS